MRYGMCNSEADHLAPLGSKSIGGELGSGEFPHWLPTASEEGLQALKRQQSRTEVQYVVVTRHSEAVTQQTCNE